MSVEMERHDWTVEEIRGNCADAPFRFPDLSRVGWKIGQCTRIELALERGSARKQRETLLREAVGESIDEGDGLRRQDFAPFR